MIWYPAPKGSLSGFKKVKILDFWYGFKKEIAIGNNAKNARPEIAKNFTLTQISWQLLIEKLIIREFNNFYDRRFEGKKSYW
mgnify:CR=1 FL=1